MLSTEIPLEIRKNIRVTTCSTEDSKTHYAKRSGIEARLPLNQTALRIAERKYKQRNPAPDYSDVLDFEAIHPDSRIKAIENDKGVKMYRVDGIDGFVFISNPFSQEEQKDWLKDTFSVYMNPPNASNLSNLYKVPENGLWRNYHECDNPPNVEKYLTNLKEDIESDVYADDPTGQVAADIKTELVPLDQALIRKIRWITLGYQYDWTSKEYKLNERYEIPKKLHDHSIEIARLLGYPAFLPESGIINYYQEKDTLTSHVDRSEKNMTAPLISYSFGETCIFLIGGKLREDPVMAMYLRSGDIAILTEDSRWFFHGN